MVPQSWMIDDLKKTKDIQQCLKFITDAMKDWKIDLVAEGKTLAEVKIQTGMFNEEELSSLQFVI